MFGQVHSMPKVALWVVLAICGLALVACKGQDQCVDDIECPGGTHCRLLSGQCVTTCTTDALCDQGQRCDVVRGRCVAGVEGCQDNIGKRCEAGHIYWYSSCGFIGKVAKDCGQSGCTGDDCNGNFSDSRCGNRKCDVGEDCLTCPTDCACQQGKICDLASSSCVPSNACGNLRCESHLNESCLSCPTDCLCPQGKICDRAAAVCKAPPSVCNNNQQCEQASGENCLNCPTDCGCQANESCQNGVCTAQSPCGNGQCEPAFGESCASCVADCKCPNGQSCQNNQCQQASLCGNGMCDTASGENCSTCPQDCSCLAGFVCSAGACQTVVRCGDGTCDATQGENCGTCPNDCSCPSGQQCEGSSCKPVSRCPNGTCDTGFGENCGNCAQDCPCTGQTQCVSGSSQASARCGDGSCQPNNGENCGTCPQDCRCTGSEICKAGICSPPQQTQCVCTAGEKKCAGDSVQECKPDCSGWTVLSTCDKNKNQFCSSLDNRCTCYTYNACSTPNTYRCVGSTREFCFQGTLCTYWSQASQQCAADETCTAGQCVKTQQCVCNVGDKQCGASNKLQRCKADCSGWEDEKTCLDGLNQFCSSLEKRCKCYTYNACTTPNAYRCTGNTREFCFQGLDCTYWTKTSTQCAADETCQAGQCVKQQQCVCTAGEKKCSGSFDLMQCRSDCSGWDKLQTCSSGLNQYCSATNKACVCFTYNACTSPGAYQCNGSSREFCFQGSQCTYWSKSSYQCDASNQPYCSGATCG